MSVTVSPTPAAWQTLPGVKKPRVLLYYPDFGATGGIERFILALSTGLKSRGHFIPIVACSADTPFYYLLQEAGLDVRGVRTFGGFVKPGWRWMDVLSLAQLKLILDEEQPDLIHVHIGQLENVWLKWLGYPVVYSFHGYSNLYSIDVPGRLKQWAKKSLRFLFRFSARRLSRMVFVSHYEHDRMLSEGYLHAGTCPVEIVHNAIDINQWRHRMASVNAAAFRQACSIPPNAVCISFINRLDANKNPLGFIQWAEGYYHLWQQSAHRDKPLMFLLAGDGPLAGETVVAISNSVISDQFRFLGFQSDIAPILANTDVAVFLPEKEGFGIGILECLTNGVPVVAPMVGGIPEMFTQELSAVCLYTSHDWEQLGQLVSQWLSMPGTAKENWQLKMVQAAERFNPNQFLERFEQIYRESF